MRHVSNKWGWSARIRALRFRLFGCCSGYVGL